MQRLIGIACIHMSYGNIFAHILRRLLSDIVEALMGHEGYLTKVYRRYSLDQLREFYQQGEHALTIFSIGQDMRQFWNDVETKNQQLQQRVTGLTYENMTLKTELQTMNDRLQVLERNNTFLQYDLSNHNENLFTQFMNYLNQHRDSNDLPPS